jgi:predicted DNA-binding transcriptional regulator
MLKMLEGIGLSKREALVYSALLETGQSTTGPIVKRTGIPASKIYAVLERLVKKGLASVIVKKGTKHFSATNPEKLVDYLEEKKREVEAQEEEVKRMLPYLREKGKGGGEHDAEVAYGFEGLKGLLHKMLSDAEKGDEWLFFSFSVDDPERFMRIYNFYREFDKPRREKGLTIKGIMPSKVKSVAGRREPVKACYVDFPVLTNTTVCGDYVLFTPWEDEEVSYLIHSRHLAKSFREQFYSIFNEYYGGRKGKGRGGQ